MKLEKPWNIDADPDNADWTKRSWDIGRPRHTLTYLKSNVWREDDSKQVRQEKLDRFLRSPSGRAMPEESRKMLRSLGYTVADEAPISNG